MPRLARNALALTLASALLAIASAQAHAQADYQPAPNFAPHANPVEDLNRAIIAAGQSHRRIVLEIGGDWNKWCHRLDLFFEFHPELRAQRDQNYIWLKINVSGENQNRQFLAGYPRIADYPHLFVLNPDGRLISSEQLKPLEDGKDISPDRMKAFLEKWSLPHSAPAIVRQPRP